MGGNESTAITAGLPGFLVLFFLALVCWFLFRDMSKRMRNVRRLAEEEDRAAERAAADKDGEPAGPTDGQASEPTDGEASADDPSSASDGKN